MKHLVASLSVVGITAISVGLLTQESHAATRVVPFAGMFALEMQTPRVHDLNRTAYCHVAIVNTGGTAQNPVVVSGYTVGNNGSTSGAINVTCSPSANLGVGQSCFAAYPITTYLDSERYGFCAGTISVTDSVATAPGSVVATGSMTFFHEAMVVGGVLSGGHYASGAVITTGNVGERSGNMNLNCAQACKAASSPPNENRVCETLCGVMELPTPYYAPMPTTISGTIDSNNTTDGSVVVTPGVTTSVPASVFYHAPGYYAGGSVYEVEIGALDAICNGNPTYISDGYSTPRGTSHNHLGGTAQAGSEVLFCGHRHNQPDLYMKVGQSVPIVINGGSAF